MPTELYAGTLTDFDDSMAKAIEDALVQLLGPLPSAPPALVDDRRKLFIAISRGVINHIRAKQAALQIDFDVGPTHVTTNPVIRVRS
jgi:hypothetical protein